MAQNEYDDYDDDDYTTDGNALAEVRKAHKAATRKIKELEAELTQFRTDSRKRSVESVLTSRGFNPRIADLIPEGLTSTDEITAWLDERADVFQPVTTGSGTDEASDGQMQSPVMQAPPGLQQFNEVVNAGQAVSGDESQIMAMIAAAKTPEELNKILFGNSAGPSVY